MGLWGSILDHIVTEGTVKGENARGRQVLAYMKQIIHDVGCGKYAEISRILAGQAKKVTLMKEADGPQVLQVIV